MARRKSTKVKVKKAPKAKRAPKPKAPPKPKKAAKPKHVRVGKRRGRLVIE